jgi:hypothetical protein
MLSRVRHRAEPEWGPKQFILRQAGIWHMIVAFAESRLCAMQRQFGVTLSMMTSVEQF